MWKHVSTQRRFRFHRLSETGIFGFCHGYLDFRISSRVMRIFKTAQKIRRVRLINYKEIIRTAHFLTSREIFPNKSRGHSRIINGKRMPLLAAEGPCHGRIIKMRNGCCCWQPLCEEHKFWESAQPLMQCRYVDLLWTDFFLFTFLAT